MDEIINNVNIEVSIHPTAAQIIAAHPNTEITKGPVHGDETMIVRVDRMPFQSFIDKAARNNSIARLSYKVDFDDRSIDFEVMLNQTSTTFKKVTFVETARALGWKDVTLDDNHMYVYPVTDEPLLEEEEKETDSRILEAPHYGNPACFIDVDEHFGDKNYCWMSQTRLTYPMNANMDGIAEANASMHCHDVVYSTFNNGPLKIASVFTTREEDPDNPYYQDDDAPVLDDDASPIDDESSDIDRSEYFNDDDVSGYFND